MKSRILSLWILLSAVVMPLTYAETSENLQNEPVFTQQELDQMLAPIALYPDALLSQILMAATYPAEVVLAARWSREHPNLKGDAAVKAAEQEDWDASVISLTAFPQILIQMDEKLEWTEQLGEAFLAQQEQVMDTVQHLRKQALAAGNLESNDQIRVLQQDRIVIIEHTSPQIVYVPYYDPHVVYGPWWWDAYPPVYWDPWPGYYSGFGPGYYRGSGIHVGLGFFYSNFDWHRHHVHVHPHHHKHSKHHHKRHQHEDRDRDRNKPQHWRHDRQQDGLRHDNPSPLAPGQALVRSKTRQDGITTPNQLQNHLNSYNRKREAAGLPPNAPTRQSTFNPTLTPDRGNTIPERVEAFKRQDNRMVRPEISSQTHTAAPTSQIPITAPRRIMSHPQPKDRFEAPEAVNRRDNHLARPDVSPQTRALAPRNPSPIMVPRQSMSQPQPIRRPESPPPGMSPGGFDRQQQAIPNNRAMPLPQRSIAGHSSPSAQPRNFGLSQPRVGNNPLQGNHGQSGGGGQYRR